MNSNNRANFQPSPARLAIPERAARIAVGIALITAAAVAPSPLGWAAVLPLIAIYPILSGIMGLEPLRFPFAYGSAGYRTAQFTIGGVLVGSAFVTSHFSGVPAEVFTLLPLAGIYYVLAGIMGRAPLASMDESANYDPLAYFGGNAVAASVTAASRGTAAISPAVSRAHAA